MEQKSAERVYVVLGATGGIGSALARNLADEGARLALGARGADELSALAEGLGAYAHPLDATRYDEVQALIDATVDRFGHVDGVANCVGSILIKPAHLTSEEEFDQTLRVNLYTAFNTVKASVRTMMSNGGGSIVLCSSAVSRTGIINHEAIAAAKAGINGLTRSAASTYARRNIRVNCVAPGLVQTPQSAHLTRNQAARDQSAAMHPMGRLGEPQEVASAIHWLLSDAHSGWVTGQTLGVDGGLGSVRPRMN